ncbi:MAG: flgK [Devosia sp.]|uniref:flagellar hook-associated protein FlgK n=1 Tax=Devosia sp. TaxID=1871048 RepID=UPI002628340B|nr:flagellar hook-associated protein FlgK [Devosia sp.]MDB5588652.1 flgK [Devosia sp.]
MGLTTSLNNAVSGLHVNQDALAVLSRNISNAGTPGYHKQSLNIIDYNSANSTYGRTAGINRAFNTSLQTYYTRQVSDTATSSVQANYLDRLQGVMGKPGSAGSLDTLFGKLQNSLQTLATSPDDYTARGQAVQTAQDMASNLNRLSNSVQDLRRETEGQIAVDVESLNGLLSSLQDVNSRMLDLGTGDASRAALADQRDRLVSSVSELIDVQADYRPNGTVALMTRSGVGIIDGAVSVFSFDSAGSLAATSQFDTDPSKTKTGKLTLTTPSGLKVDLVEHSVIQGGELGGLLTLRDKTLVEAQSQLDEIAGNLAQAFSTVQTPGTAIPNGYSSNTTNVAPGNDLMLKVKVGGVEQTVKIVNTKQPNVDYRDASGNRVIGVDMASGDAAVVSQLTAAFASTANGPSLGVTVTANAGQLDFTGAGTTQVTGLTKRSTSTGLQGQGLALNLFVDSDNGAFTNDLDGNPPQKLGFAARISINNAVLADNSLMVRAQAGQTLGDAARPNMMIDQLNSMQFVGGGNPASDKGQFQLSGKLGDIIGQVIGFQGSSTQKVLTQSSDRQLALDTIVQQMGVEYGVNVDEEMARLMDLQNSYSANAQVVGVVKELLTALLNAV